MITMVAVCQSNILTIKYVVWHLSWRARGWWEGRSDARAGKGRGVEGPFESLDPPRKRSTGCGFELGGHWGCEGGRESFCGVGGLAAALSGGREENVLLRGGRDLSVFLDCRCRFVDRLDLLQLGPRLHTCHHIRHGTLAHLDIRIDHRGGLIHRLGLLQRYPGESITGGRSCCGHICGSICVTLPFE